MRFSYQEIKQAILEELPNLDTYDDRERFRQEFADGLLPVYFGDIIDDWKDLDPEFSNAYLDHIDLEKQTIYDLMNIDLYLFYESQIDLIFREIEDKELEDIED
jgi:hypothetical protein